MPARSPRILHVAAAQILFLDVPDHAAVNLAVAQAASDRRTGRARGLVNGVLRRLARERDEILARPDAAAAATRRPGSSSAGAQTYGEATAEEIAAAHLEQPGLDLSVKRDAATLGGAARRRAASDRLGPPRRTRTASPELAGFEEGAWWVQDAAAALPARSSATSRARRVADLCAAPGGKTAAARRRRRATSPRSTSPTSRLKRLAENLARLGLEARARRGRHPGMGAGRKIRRRAPRRALLGDRHHPPPSRHPLAEAAGGHRHARRAAGENARPRRRAGEARRAAGLLHLLARAGGRRGAGRAVPRAPSRSSRSSRSSRRRSPVSRDLLTPAGTLRTLPCHGFGDEPILHGMDGFFAARFRRR